MVSIQVRESTNCFIRAIFLYDAHFLVGIHDQKKIRTFVTCTDSKEDTVELGTQTSPHNVATCNIRRSWYLDLYGTLNQSKCFLCVYVKAKHHKAIQRPNETHYTVCFCTHYSNILQWRNIALLFKGDWHFCRSYHAFSSCHKATSSSMHQDRHSFVLLHLLWHP